MEELDRVERRRHEEQERELLLRAAKSRAKTEDPEQAKLKAKAKEVYKFLRIIYLQFCISRYSANVPFFILFFFFNLLIFIINGSVLQK